jgi:hypothetical protein
MLTIKNASIVTLLATAATAAAPGLAAADHARNASWTQLAEVGTHAHDAEDYVEVDGRLRLDRVELRATDGNVPVDGLRVKLTDGRTIYTDVHRLLRQGESVMVDLPEGARVKLLTIDYGNRAPFWQARETAHLQVSAQLEQRDGRYRDHRAQAPRRVRVQSYQAPVTQAPVYQAPYQPAYPASRGFEWRGGIQVRIR